MYTYTHSELKVVFFYMWTHMYSPWTRKAAFSTGTQVRMQGSSAENTEKLGADLDASALDLSIQPGNRFCSISKVWAFCSSTAGTT